MTQSRRHSFAEAVPARPVLRWHGGKWKLAPWITSYFPPHRIYVEMFGGAASVLIRKPRSYAEVYNDLDSEVVNLFRVLRNKYQAESLKNQLELTPFARDEFLESYQFPDGGDPVEQARRLVIRSFMGFSSNAHNSVSRTGFRANSNRSGTTPAHDWVKWPEQIPVFIERLKGVVIENRNALDIISQHDSTETLHYADPPYVWETRKGIGQGHKNHAYRHELTDNHHIELAEVLNNVKGMVVLSGYACDLYDRKLYKHWHRYERKAYADGARERVEVLWLNEAAANKLTESKSQIEADV